jgi:hypothetical protein
VSYQSQADQGEAESRLTLEGDCDVRERMMAKKATESQPATTEYKSRASLKRAETVLEKVLFNSQIGRAHV